MILKVKRAFQDKYNLEVTLVPGDLLQTDELDRVNDLVSRQLAEIVSVENDDAKVAKAEKSEESESIPETTKETEPKTNKPAPKATKDKEPKKKEPTSKVTNKKE